ncbi:hypothetical protein [Halorussus halobius]|uniref:hypothetical protein n=1 Tax=Halorussus halobius TaxID=1710537 RepID=UPI001092D822|nr:hypothetical protein [Halorussus halobius]
MGVEQSMRTVDRAVEESIGKRQQYRNDDSGRSQRRTYEKSLEAVDDLAGEAAAQRLASWIAETIREKEKLPPSRRVRKKGAEICRDAGYSVSTNDWLGS